MVPNNIELGQITDTYSSKNRVESIWTCFFSKRRFGIRWFGIRWPEISVLIRDLWWDGHHSKWVPHQNTKTVLIPHGLWHLEINICLVVSALYFGCRTIGIWTASKSDLGRFLTATSFTYFLLIAGLLVIGSISAGLDLYAFSVLGLALVRPLVTRLTDRPMVNNPAGTDTGSAYLTTTTGMQAVATRLVCLNCLNNVIGISLLQSSEISTRVIQASFLHRLSQTQGSFTATFGNQYMLGLDTNGQSNAVSFSCALHCPILFESNTINVPERSLITVSKNIEINTKANVIRKKDCLKLDVLLYSYFWLFLYYQTFFDSTNWLAQMANCARAQGTATLAATAATIARGSNGLIFRIEGAITKKTLPILGEWINSVDYIIRGVPSQIVRNGHASISKTSGVVYKYR